MQKILKKLAAIAKNPYLQLFVALVLIGSSLMETISSIDEDVAKLHVRVFHGTLLLGIMHLFRTLPEVVDGIERLAKVTITEEE